MQVRRIIIVIASFANSYILIDTLCTTLVFRMRIFHFTISMQFSNNNNDNNCSLIVPYLIYDYQTGSLEICISPDTI